MSAVLKKSNINRENSVRPLLEILEEGVFGAGSILPSQKPMKETAEPVAENTDQNPLEHEVAFKSLERENEKLVLALESAKAEIASVREKALQDGKEQAERLEKERLEALKKALSDCGGSIEKQISELEPVALMVAQTALNKILGSNADTKNIVAKAIKNQIRTIEDNCVVSVTVSKSDFSDEAALDALSKQLDCPKFEILSEGTLDSGACELKMKLGTVDIGIPNQLAQLNSLISSMIAEEQT